MYNQNIECIEKKISSHSLAVILFEHTVRLCFTAMFSSVTMECLFLKAKTVH